MFRRLLGAKAPLQRWAGAGPSAPPGGVLQRAAAALPGWARASSSATGLERSGVERMDYDQRGRLEGPTKGGRGRRSLAGVIAIRNTWNNTLVSIADASYKQLGSASGGTVGFKKSKRSSQFATEKCLSAAFAKAREVGIHRVHLRLSGPAVLVRKPLFRQLREEVGLRIMKLTYNDNVPHGGCRPRKSRRRRWKTRARKKG